MNIFNLNDENFTLYAASNYKNPHYTVAEFEEDLSRIKYIKRLFNKHTNNGEPKERLILNHIIILSNVFGVQPTVKMLFFKLGPEYYTYLKTFLIFLGFMPDQIISINGKIINSSDILIDMDIANTLRNI